MADNGPILVTGAAGQLGAVGRTVCGLLLDRGLRFAPSMVSHEFLPRNTPINSMTKAGGFSPSMPFALSLACFGMRLTFEEALVAATINAAYSLDRHERVGSLEEGKQCDALVLDGPAIDVLRVGAETIRHVVKRGRIVFGREP